MPIPPKGWGAVESLVWDYSHTLSKMGIETQIVNTRNIGDIIKEVNDFNPDFVHLQYDDHIDCLNGINCRFKAVTSHFAYLDQPDRYSTYSSIFSKFISGDFFIFALSDSIANQYIKNGCSSSKVFVTPNGARMDLFRYSEEAKYPNKSVYLAKITDRKKQYLYQSIESVDFVGNLDDARFDNLRSNYIGEWEKSTLYDNLTDYGNLVLLSDGEAHPLVCCEALVCGLGLVISEYAASNLDKSLPFISVIPNDNLSDIEYVNSVIDENRRISVSMRGEIRKYGSLNFSWDNRIEKYIGLVNSIIG